MKRLISKYNYLSNFIIYIFPTLLYVFNIRNIVFPINYQQDDVRELYISEYLDFSCILDKGDNHPLWTYLIWFLAKINFIELGYLVSSLNIFLLILSIYFIVKFFKEKYDYKVATLISIIFVSSPAVLTYSVSLKQYTLELLFSSYCLYISRNNVTLNKKLNSIYFYLVAIPLIMGSLVNAAVFCLLIFYYLVENKFKIINLKYWLVFFIPVIIYFERILDKVSREAYSSYWENFFITSSVSSELFNKFTFIFNMLFKSYFGFFYKDQLVYLLILVIFAVILYKFKQNLFPKLVFLAFLLLNLLKLYPLGTGRTDIVLFPFILVFVGEVLNFILRKLNISSFYLLTLVVLTAAFLNVDSYYKQEQIDEALQQIQKSLTEDITIIIAEEQFPSFDYYGRKVFGSKVVKENNCQVLKPNLDYYVIGRKHISNRKIIDEFFSIYNNSKILILGIELESRGVFRDIEDALYVKKYKLTKSNIYPDGIYLNFYEITN